MITTILLCLSGYCAATYLTYWLWIVKPFSKIRGCSLGTLTNAMMMFAPFLIPIFLWEEIKSLVEYRLVK